MVSESVITSVHNPQVKRLVRLRQRRDREEEGVILIEGAREVQRAARAGVTVHDLYLCPPLYSPEAEDVAATLPGRRAVLSGPAFEKVSGRDRPDGVLGVAATPDVALPDPGRDAVVVVLHGLEKPGNVGAIVRTADAVGASGVIVLGRGADPFGPNVIRASQGSVFSVPVVAWEEDRALAWLRAHDFRLVACTPDAPAVYWDATLTGRVALLLGTEHQGLPGAWRGAGGVSIPMNAGGGADSLNVATAAALMLYESARQQRARAAAGSPA
ncbi:TrmH family RNA methyltransferase [Deinococcus metalli]|uniref:TrmH family RNA methyltransferase n=1 Tax=Deinococcus metalli TaxID=1141878 RepID=A0A7W8KC16_9DEIO|nr:RNA methyltransferase [Deinococcus metalli]MBB5375415.1 TrmH family RNA methyltransferase [Deinococcus metalli]GHF29453.1 rRNA methyltransferase [Deinococcus metalli]